MLFRSAQIFVLAKSSRDIKIVSLLVVLHRPASISAARDIARLANKSPRGRGSLAENKDKLRERGLRFFLPILLFKLLILSASFS